MPKYTILAKDFHSPLVRNEIWVQGLRQWSRYFGVPDADMGIVSRENAIWYISDVRTFNRAREVFRAKIDANPTELANVMVLSETWGQEMNAYTGTLSTMDLPARTGEELISSYTRFAELQARQYAVGALLPLIDLGGGSFLEVWLQTYLASRLPEDERNRAFSIFTTPVKNSFSLDQEEALLRLATELFNDASVRTLFVSAKAQDIVTQLPSISSAAWKKLQEHTAEFSWVYYVYQGPAYTEVQFADFLKQIALSGKDPSAQLVELHLARKALLAERDTLIARLAPDEREKKLLLLVAEFVWSKPRRKDYQSKSYFHVETFFRELARRADISLRHARSATQEQIARMLRGEKIETKLLQSQYLFHVVVGEGSERERVLVGTDAEAFMSRVTEEQGVSVDMDEIRGSTAFPGSARGIVCVVNRSEDIDKMQPGAILVSIATTPSIVVAMKRAAAIVTDEGGLTCHAAIVSRELKIPCVVGTKIASQALKDGDEVEVDAVNGIVKVLKRA